MAASFMNSRSIFVTEPNASNLWFGQTKKIIREMIGKVELPCSSYDTAWVALVPSPNSPEVPCFPECVKWVLNNQLHDGSWGLPQRHPSLTKDALTSTLACVIALKRWDVGEDSVNKGLSFVERNFASATREYDHSPIGFDIIFPGLIEFACELNLNVRLGSASVEALLQKRDLELKSGCSGQLTRTSTNPTGLEVTKSFEDNPDGSAAYLAYVSEGLGKLHDWKAIMKFQRKNGSLFNSPSTTAAALTHIQNAGCLNYLHNLLNKFGNSVPTVYPSDIYVNLCTVDTLVRLGIDRHFRSEIRNVLDETYRCWLLGEEEIFLDVETCAMAFRLLRGNGYDVSSDSLSLFAKEDHYFSSFGGDSRTISAVLELFRASELMYLDEHVLERINSRSRNFLKQELSRNSTLPDGLVTYIRNEVDDALKFPCHANLERLANRRYMSYYNAENIRILKTSYKLTSMGNEDLLKLAVADFNICQSTHRDEIECLERWVLENQLDKLKFARQKLPYCYFSAAATIFFPELSEARISWAKNGVLTTVVDDFFDIGGSEEELANLIQLVEGWDSNAGTYYCSKEVEIIYSALRSTIFEIGDEAFTRQARSVMAHLIKTWLDLLKSMLRETEWARNKLVPTMEEYMENAYVSFALGPIVLPALYLVGPKLSNEIVESAEYQNLFKLMSTCGRLLNDIHSFKRESAEGKLNALSLSMRESGGSITEEQEAAREMMVVIERKRKELMELVLKDKGSVVPRACKDLFWNMTKVLHLFYMKDDGFTSHDMFDAVNAVLHKPLDINQVLN